MKSRKEYLEMVVATDEDEEVMVWSRTVWIKRQAPVHDLAHDLLGARRPESDPANCNFVSVLI